MGNQPLRAHTGVPASDLPSRWYGDPDSPVDNVTRKLAYEDRHPDVRLVPPCVHDGCWTAVLEAGLWSSGRWTWGCCWTSWKPGTGRAARKRALPRAATWRGFGGARAERIPRTTSP